MYMHSSTIVSDSRVLPRLLIWHQALFLEADLGEKTVLPDLDNDAVSDVPIHQRREPVLRKQEGREK